MLVNWRDDFFMHGKALDYAVKQLMKLFERVV